MTSGGKRRLCEAGRARRLARKIAPINIACPRCTRLTQGRHRPPADGCFRLPPCQPLSVTLRRITSERCNDAMDAAVHCCMAWPRCCTVAHHPHALTLAGPCRFMSTGLLRLRIARIQASLDKYRLKQDRWRGHACLLA